jgi:hypothetical protein
MDALLEKLSAIADAQIAEEKQKLGYKQDN